MSYQRRRAEVNLVQPDIDHLLNDNGAFEKGKEAREFLFTELFVNQMFRSAKVDKTVHEAFATAAAAVKAVFFPRSSLDSLVTVSTWIHLIEANLRVALLVPVDEATEDVVDYAVEVIPTAA